MGDIEERIKKLEENQKMIINLCDANDARIRMILEFLGAKKEDG